jgi:serine/threonine-protein kinase
VESALGSADRPVAGRYLLVDQIGSGGMGTVWRAFDLRTQSWLAVKLLTQRSSSLLLRFVRE